MAGGMTYGNQLMVNDTSVKRRSSHLSNSNITLKSGYSPIDDVLYKTGIRGPKKYTLYAVIVILFIIALGNILTTFVLLGVLHLGYGMQSLEFIPSKWVIRILQSANIEVVLPLNGIIGSFEGEALRIIGNNQPVLLKTQTKASPELEVHPNQTVVSNVDFFKVVDPNTGQPVFSTERSAFVLSKAVKKFAAHDVETNKIASPINKTLTIKSDVQIRMKGNEGMHMTSLEFVLSTDKDVYLRSRNSSILLNGHQSIMLNMKKLLLYGHSSDDSWQYKICVCMPRGRLFRIKMKNNNDNCEKALLGNNLCL